MALEKWDLALVLQQAHGGGPEMKERVSISPCGRQVPLVHPGHCHPRSSAANLPEHLCGTTLLFA